MNANSEAAGSGQAAALTIDDAIELVGRAPRYEVISLAVAVLVAANELGPDFPDWFIEFDRRVNEIMDELLGEQE